MKQIVAYLFSYILATHLFSQGKKDSCCISMKDLVGVWQRDYEKVGNALLQNFRFFDDGIFEIRFANENEDARGIYSLKGNDWHIFLHAIIIQIK